MTKCTLCGSNKPIWKRVKDLKNNPDLKHICDNCLMTEFEDVDKEIDNYKYAPIIEPKKEAVE